MIDNFRIIGSKFWKGGGAAVYCVKWMNFWYLQMYKNKILIQKNASTNDIFETKLISNWLFWIENKKSGESFDPAENINRWEHNMAHNMVSTYKIALLVGLKLNWRKIWFFYWGWFHLDDWRSKDLMSHSVAQ